MRTCKLVTYNLTIYDLDLYVPVPTHTHLVPADVGNKQIS